MLKLIKAVILPVFLTAVLFLPSCASSEPSDTDAITMALELSGIYAKNQEFEKAIDVLDRALTISSDTRLYQNKVLILEQMDKYEEALSVSLDAYRENPYVEKMLRSSVELASYLKKDEILKELYAYMFSINAITVDDLVFVIKEAKKNNDGDEIIQKLIDYGIRWQLYNKEFLELAYEMTGDEDYKLAANYIKE